MPIFIEISFAYLFIFLFVLLKGLATIPSTAFYSDGHKKIAENYIRFCFFKVYYILNKHKHCKSLFITLWG